jgi:hypothetical protein
MLSCFIIHNDQLLKQFNGKSLGTRLPHTQGILPPTKAKMALASSDHMTSKSPVFAWGVQL